MFVKKINKNFSCLICLVVLLITFTSAKSHEMWFEAIDFSVKAGDFILANEKVGRNFNGNSYAYLDNSFKSLDIAVEGGKKKINARLGDIPTIQQKTDEEGLHIIVSETTPSELVYEKGETFEKFLEAEGLKWVSVVHQSRGLPEKGFKEIYRRNAKSLIKVGHGEGKDRSYGLPFEWVALTNPYHTEGQIRLQLLWQGKPAVDMHVNVFNKSKNRSTISDFSKISLRTDENGQIEVSRMDGGLFLINSVKMLQASESLQKETGAVWESIWGSMTYELE